MSNRMRRAALAALVVCVLPGVLPGPARADGDPVPYDGLVFDDANHRLWYARFWTGRCTGLGLFVCFSGRPYWHETMRRLTAAAAPERRHALSARLLALGRRIGHEWAKENDVRKISTDHIRAWYRELEKGGDPEPAIARIEAEALRLLAGR
jgi:hypothetical protein